MPLVTSQPAAVAPAPRHCRALLQELLIRGIKRHVGAQLERVKRSVWRPRGRSSNERESCYTLLCPASVTDVRRNVWVVRSLLRVSAEPDHGASPLRPSSLHRLPTTPFLSPPPAWLAGREAKWCEAASSSDKLHYSSSENTAAPHRSTCRYSQ